MRKLTSREIWQRIDNSGEDSYDIASDPRSGKLGTLNDDDGSDDDGDDDDDDDDDYDCQGVP